MFVSQLRDDLGNFKPEGTVTIAVPTAAGMHQMRAITAVGHIGHGTDVKQDLALDIQTDPWDAPPMQRIGRQMQISDLLHSLECYHDEMHVRVAVPLVTHETVAYRMLDIVSIGFTVGSGKGFGVQMVCENWDNLYQIIKSKDEVDVAG